MTPLMIWQEANSILTKFSAQHSVYGLACLIFNIDVIYVYLHDT